MSDCIMPSEQFSDISLGEQVTFNKMTKPTNTNFIFVCLI